MRVLIVALLCALSYAQTVLSNGKELSVDTVGLRCLTANLVFNQIVASEVACAEQALLITPDTPMYFSYRADRNKCEIPGAANAVADCNSGEANAKWTIYIITDAAAVDDACGVPGGDGSSCAGCDGVPNSGAVDDLCGVCQGSNACLGCDGIANSGAVDDACGVCGGDGSTCAGCDGVPGSGVTVDVCGVCGGNGSSCCSSSSECGADAYCNFDDTTTGNCEQCSNVATTCSDEDFDTSLGQDACEAVCERESGCPYPQPMCFMQKIFHPDRGSETDPEKRFFAIGKLVKRTLRNKAMADGSKPLAKWMWLQMKDIVKFEGYSRQSFWRLETQFDHLLAVYEGEATEEPIIVMG